MTDAQRSMDALSVSLQPWPGGRTIDLVPSARTTVGDLARDLTRLLGLPDVDGAGRRVRYVLEGADEAVGAVTSMRVADLDSPRLVLREHAESDERIRLRGRLNAVGMEIRAAVEQEIDLALDDLQNRATDEIRGVIRDVREDVTRRVAELVASRGRTWWSQLRGSASLRLFGRSGDLGEYHEAIDAGLRRAERAAHGVTRAGRWVGGRIGSAGASALVPSAAVVVTAAGIAGVLDASGTDPETDLPVASSTTEVAHEHQPAPHEHPVPDQPTTTVAPTPVPTTHDHHRMAEVDHVVEPGQTLWDIVDDACGEAPRRTQAKSVSATWFRNVETIGADPDHLDVGDVILVVCEN